MPPYILSNKNLQYNNIKLLFPERIILSRYLTRIREDRPSFWKDPATCLQFINEIFAEENNGGCRLHAHVLQTTESQRLF